MALHFIGQTAATSLSDGSPLHWSDSCHFFIRWLSTSLVRLLPLLYPTDFTSLVRQLPLPCPMSSISLVRQLLLLYPMVLHFVSQTAGTSLSDVSLLHWSDSCRWLHFIYGSSVQSRDSVFKLLRSPGIDSDKSIPPAYVA
jgi:hypothetical protein